MSWDAPQALGGPVLAWELARASRQPWLQDVRLGYSIWLILQGLVMFAVVGSLYRSSSAPSSYLELQQQQLSSRDEFLNDYLSLLLRQQLLLLALVVPALTAGSLGQEKERGTLFALFGTELTSWQIVIGKLLGRLVHLVPVALTPLPALIVMTVLIDRPLNPLLPALLQEAMVTFALGAGCMLLAIRLRRASDAVLAGYALLGLGVLAVRLVDVSLPVAIRLDPMKNLSDLLVVEGEDRLSAFLVHLVLWAGAGVLCLVLAVARIRKACLEQGDKKPSRRLWAFRPPVGDNPIRWREQHVIGLAPLPFLRVVPRWLALLGVFLFSSATAILAAETVASGFVAALLEARFGTASTVLLAEHDKVGEAMPIVGLTFIFMAEALVGVRCLTSVAEEKRRNTWDDLLLTARSFREITRSKMWGVLSAMVPYVIAYSVPVFALASVGGPWTMLVAGCWVILPCVAVYVGALMGMEMLRVPPDMDETREGGAFHFERDFDRRRWRLGTWEDPV